MTQIELETLTPEEFAYFLAHGEGDFTPDQEITWDQSAYVSVHTHQ